MYAWKVERGQVDTPSSARKPVLGLVNAQDHHQPRSKVKPWKADAAYRDTEYPYFTERSVARSSHEINPTGPETWRNRARSNQTVRLWSRMRLPDGQPVGCR